MKGSKKKQNYNLLSPGKTERLALLAEEMGEATQIIGKILRHGYNESHPDSPHKFNRSHLEEELGHVCYAIALLCKNEDINEVAIAQHSVAKENRVGKYLHHQDFTEVF